MVPTLASIGDYLLIIRPYERNLHLPRDISFGMSRSDGCNNKNFVKESKQFDLLLFIRVFFYINYQAKQYQKAKKRPVAT